MCKLHSVYKIIHCIHCVILHRGSQIIIHYTVKGQFFAFNLEKNYTRQKKFTQAPPVVPVTNMRYARKIAMICVIHLSPPPQRIESLPPLAQPPRHENFTWMCLGCVYGKYLAERHLLVVVGTRFRLKKFLWEISFCQNFSSIWKFSVEIPVSQKLGWKLVSEEVGFQQKSLRRVGMEIKSARRTPCLWFGLFGEVN